MLDRRNSAAFGLSDHGAEFGRRDRKMPGVDEAVATAGKSCSEKDDAVVGFGGMKNDFDFSTGVNADSG